MKDVLGFYETQQKPFKSLDAARFKKDAIRVGRFVLPDGRELDVTHERMDGWVTRHTAMKAAGLRIPFPIDHSKDSADNMGFVEALSREGDTLYCVVDVPRGEDASKIGTTIREVSISVDPDYQDGTGARWGEVIRHVAPCTEPVVPGQQNFVPLAASGRQGDGPGALAHPELKVIYCRRKEVQPMGLREEIVKLLGLAEADADTDEKVSTALKAKLEGHTAQLRQVKAERDQVIARGVEKDKEIENLRKKTPPDKHDTPEMAEMRSRLDRIVRQGADSRIAQLRAEGKIVPAMEDPLRALLTTSEMKLSIKGEESDVAGAVDKCFACLPKGAALDLSERTRQFREESNPNDKDKDKTPEELREAGKKLAELAQPKK